MLFFTSGSETLRIDSSGHVQIGSTTSDSFRFKVVNGAGTLARFTDGTSQTLDIRQASGGIELQNPNNGFISFKGSSAERMRIDSSGNVGIGTTSVSSPGSYNKTVQISNGDSSSVVLSRTNSTAHSLEIGVFSGASLIESTGATSLRFKTNGSERLRVDSSGKVLIGSTAGSALGDRLLQVGKTDRVDTYISIVTNTSGTGGLLFADTTSNDTGGYRGIVDYQHSSDHMRFFTGANERMRIDSSGRLLVGTTTEGHTNADNLTISDSGNCGFTIRSGTSSEGNLFFSDGTSGNDEFRGYLQYIHSTNTLKFGVNASEVARIDSI